MTMDRGAAGGQPASDAPTQDDTGRLPWRETLMIFALLATLGLGASVVYWLIGMGPVQDRISEGFEGVVLLIAGFVTVTIFLYLGTIILRGLGMGAPTEALGMPEGSIRALIAMSLILIFAIIGVLVFRAGEGGEPETSSGLTRADIASLRADGSQIISQVQDGPPAEGQEPTFTVRSRPGMSDDSHDFGLQLLSTVATLVVAVAGFYFGSRSVADAGKTVTDQLTAIQAGRSGGGGGAPGAAGDEIVGPNPDTGAQVEPQPADDDEVTDPDAQERAAANDLDAATADATAARATADEATKSSAVAAAAAQDAAATAASARAAAKTAADTAAATGTAEAQAAAADAEADAQAAEANATAMQEAATTAEADAATARQAAEEAEALRDQLAGEVN